MRFAAAVRTFAIVLATLSAMANAATVYVTTTGNDANTGQTWTTAKRAVQAGLNAAAAGDQVWVAAGTYIENITLKSGVALYGGFAGSETQLSQRNWTTNVTTLDGNRVDSVVTVPAGATASTRIDGFTIRNGLRVDGGGVFCIDSCSPTIANNTITVNVAARGAGIHWGGSSAPAFEGNTITGNCADTSGNGIGCDGDYSFSGSAVIRNNTITNNDCPISPPARSGAA